MNPCSVGLGGPSAHARRRLIPLLACSAVLYGCDGPRTTDSALRGDSGSGAYFSPPDNSALNDYTGYQPAPYEPISAASSGRPSDSTATGSTGSDAGSGVEGQVRSAVKEMVRLLVAGKAQQAIQSLVADQAAAFSDPRLDPILPTFEKYALLRKTVEEKFGVAAAEEADRRLLGIPDGGPQVAVLSETSATVEPSPLAVLLGSGFPRGPMTLTRAENQWRAALASLPDETAFTRAAEFHKNLQDELDALILGVESGTMDKPSLLKALEHEARGDAGSSAAPSNGNGAAETSGDTGDGKP